MGVEEEPPVHARPAPTTARLQQGTVPTFTYCQQAMAFKRAEPGQ